MPDNPWPDSYDPEAILADPDAHPTHKLYAAINLGVRDRGERWAKCANCGLPYQLHHKGEPYVLVLSTDGARIGVTATEDWNDGTVCSQPCFDEFVRYLNNPEG